VSGELGLGVEMHFAEEGYWKYYVSAYGVREGFSETAKSGDGRSNALNTDFRNNAHSNYNSSRNDGVMMKKTTVMIIEVEDFVVRLRVKAKSVNDSEYMGVFLEREVKVFTKEIAQALLF
jgi:hypothetical protein